jgi:hypothetical protein
MIRFLEFVKSMELWTSPNHGVLEADCDILTAGTICYENFEKKVLSKSSGFDRQIIQQTYLAKTQTQLHLKSMQGRSLNE